MCSTPHTHPLPASSALPWRERLTLFLFFCFRGGFSSNQEMLQQLVCSPRLVATGGFCADHSSQPLYAHLIDPKFSRTELINHGDLKTFDELRRESEDREAAEHHHFS